MKRAQDAGRNAPTQRAGIAPHFYFSDGAFFQLNHGFASTVADEASEKLAQVGIMAHEKQRILPRILF